MYVMKILMSLIKQIFYINKEISTSCLKCIDSNEFNSLRNLNKDIEEDKANSRKRTLKFDGV